MSAAGRPVHQDSARSVAPGQADQSNPAAWPRCADGGPLQATCPLRTFAESIALTWGDPAPGITAGYYKIGSAPTANFDTSGHLATLGGSATITGGADTQYVNTFGLQYEGDQGQPMVN